MANGVTLTEPEQPAPTTGDLPKPIVDDCIVKATIYPPIGVCRVGNSPDEFYIGPEVDYPEPLPPGSYRDKEGRLKREAARFRIYGLNALGQAVRNFLSESLINLKSASALLEGYSYARVLERGFALVRDSSGSNIRSAKSITSGADLTIRFHDGDVGVQAQGAKPKGKAKPPRSSDGNNDQGTLL